MVAHHYGKSVPLTTLAKTTRTGSNLAGMADAAERIGLRTRSVKTDFAKFSQDAPLLAVLHWQVNHYVVVYKITKCRPRPRPAMLLTGRV